MSLTLNNELIGRMVELIGRMVYLIGRMFYPGLSAIEHSILDYHHLS